MFRAEWIARLQAIKTTLQEEGEYNNYTKSAKWASSVVTQRLANHRAGPIKRASDKVWTKAEKSKTLLNQVIKISILQHKQEA
jgi:hypothetical protein